MRITVAPGQWPGDDLSTTLRAVDWAQQLGASGVWFSEVNGYDSVALAALAANIAPTVEITIGPVAAGARSPAQMAMAAATVAAVSRVAPRLALGAANRKIVGEWHGRDASNSPRTVSDHVAALRQALSGSRTSGETSTGFRLAVTAPTATTIAIAALGPRMLAVAGAYADTLVLNLVPPAGVESLVAVAAAAAENSGRAVPQVAVWMIAGSVAVSGPRVASFLRPYLDADGYGPALAASGITLPIDPAHALALLTGLGSADVVTERALAYSRAGVAEIVVVGSPSDPSVGEAITALTALDVPETTHGPQPDQESSM